MKWRVALVDDHQVFRDGLKLLVSQQPDLVVVGEASDARRAYDVAERQRPDVVVLDVSLPGVDGITATEELRRRVPELKVLMLSMHSGRDYAARALAAGAAGYVVKTETIDVVLRAIRTVACGETYLPPAFSSLRDRPPDLASDEPAIALLSVRERQVFGLLVRGFSNQAVANELCISVKTVETHRTRIHAKLDVHSVAELMRFAALNGLIRE